MNGYNFQARNTLISKIFLSLAIVALAMSTLAGTSIAAPLAQAEPVIELVQTGVDTASYFVNNALVFRVRAYDPSVGTSDGAGIDYVDMIILDEDGDEVYRKREQTAGYCAFGGGEPNCTVYDFDDANNRWPNRNGQQGDRIRFGEEYTLRAIAVSDRGGRADADFSVVFEESQSEPVVELVRTGVNSTSSNVNGALVFRVRAFDPAVGTQDGAGIDFVDMIILDEDDDEVYRKREQTPGYCSFGGGEPNCAVYDFEDNDNRWPDRDGQRGDPIREDEDYTLRAIAVTDDGRSVELNSEIQISLNAQATATVDTGGRRLNVRSGPSASFAIIAQIEDGSTYPVVGRNQNGTWIQIALSSSRRGWVAAQFVQIDQSLNSLPVTS